MEKSLAGGHIIKKLQLKQIFVEFLLVCDPVGIQTQDLQNRNLTLYSAKLRDRMAIKRCKGTFLN